jgi:cytochrome c556
METVADLARASGTGPAKPAPASLNRKLPLEFKQIALSVQQDFDQMALDAEHLDDPANSLHQLADITAKCLACHASFRLQPEHS